MMRLLDITFYSTDILVLHTLRYIKVIHVLLDLTAPMQSPKHGGPEKQVVLGNISLPQKVSSITFTLCKVQLDESRSLIFNVVIHISA